LRKQHGLRFEESEELDGARRGGALGVLVARDCQELRGAEAYGARSGAECEARAKAITGARRACIEALEPFAAQRRDPRAAGVLTAGVVPGRADGRPALMERDGHAEAVAGRRGGVRDHALRVPRAAAQCVDDGGAAADASFRAARRRCTHDHHAARERDAGSVPADRARGCVQGLCKLPSGGGAVQQVDGAGARRQGAGAGFADGDPVTVHRDRRAKTRAGGGQGRTDARHVRDGAVGCRPDVEYVHRACIAFRRIRAR